MNDSSYQEEGDDDGGSALVPFPSRTLHRAGSRSRPLPEFPHPSADYPLPPSSSLYPLPSTFSPSPPLSHKLSAASLASASSANCNNLLRPQPSLQALYTPTPTTPNIVERTWTRKISIWPPPVTDGDDPFAPNPPTTQVVPASFQVHITMPSRDESLACQEVTDAECMMLKTPVAVRNGAGFAHSMGAMEDAPDSPASATSIATVIHGHHDLHDGWTEIFASSTPSLNHDATPASSPTKTHTAEPTTPKSAMKRTGSIRRRWRSIARRALASAEAERSPKRRKGSTSDVSNKFTQAQNRTGDFVEVVKPEQSAAAVDGVSDSASANGAVPITETISGTSMGTNGPSGATVMANQFTAIGDDKSTPHSTAALTMTSMPPIPARSPARRHTTAPLAIPVFSPTSDELSPAPASVRPTTPTSIRSSKSKRQGYPKLFIDTGSASPTRRNVEMRGLGTPETVTTAGQGAAHTFVSAHEHGNSQRRGSEDSTRRTSPPVASFSANARIRSRIIATPMSSPSVYTPSPHSIHVPTKVAGPATTKAPMSTSINPDTSAEEASEPEFEPRTRRSSMTVASTYTNHSHSSISTSSLHSRNRSFSLSGSSVLTRSTAATSLQSRNQRQGVPSPASITRRRGSLKPDDDERNEADCVPPVPKVSAGVHGHVPRPAAEGNGAEECGVEPVKDDPEIDNETLPTPKPLPTVQCPSLPTWDSTSKPPSGHGVELPHSKPAQHHVDPSSPSTVHTGATATAIPRTRPRSRTELNMYPPDHGEWRFSRNSTYAAFDTFLKDPHRASLDLSLSLPPSRTTPAQSASQTMQQSSSAPIRPNPTKSYSTPPPGVDGSADKSGQDANARVRARILSLAASQMSPYAINIPFTTSSLASSTLPSSPARPHGTYPDDSPSRPNDAKVRSKLTKPSEKRLKTQRSIAKLEQEAFRESDELSTADVYRAAQLDVLNVDGEKVRFGSLFEDTLTIVCFIRHFWCPHCQDYMQSIVDGAPKEALDRAGVRLVVVGCGSPTMAKAYKDAVFHSPYDIYVDPTRSLYRALGMTRRTSDGGAEEDKGEYVVHGPVSGIGMVLKNALKMPLSNPGDMKQLGGEFLLGPGIRSDYCHRMPTTRGHTSISQLLQLAGVDSRGFGTECAVPETLPSLGARPRAAPESPFTAPLPPHLDVHADDAIIRQRKDTWDEFIRWTQERRFSYNMLTPDATRVQETYPYALADQRGHGGLCGAGGTTAYCSGFGRAHQDTTACGVRVC